MKQNDYDKAARWLLEARPHPANKESYARWSSLCVMMACLFRDGDLNFKVKFFHVDCGLKRQK